MPGISTVANVCTHVPGFVRNSPDGVQDAAIQTWIDTRWEEINSILTRRALPVPAVNTDGYNLLELMNRMGAAADLAAAMSTFMSPNTRWQVEKNLRDDFIRQLTRLDDGELDKQLNPAAKTDDVAPRFEGDSGTCNGGRFSMDMRF